MRVVLSLLCMFTLGQMTAQTAFSALFEKTDKEILSLYEVSMADIQKRNDELSPEGFELIDLEFYHGKCYGIWEKTGKPVTFDEAEGWEAFQELKKAKIKEGLLLADVETYTDEEGLTKIVGLWKNKKHPHNIWKLPNLKSIEFHHKELAKLGLHLEDIETMDDGNGSIAYLALYHKGNADDKTHFTQFSNEAMFNTDRSKRFKSGYACIDFEVALRGDVPYYMALYKKLPKVQDLSYQLEFDGYVQFQDFLGSTYKTVDLELNDGFLRPFSAPSYTKRASKTPDIDMKKIDVATRGADDEALRNRSGAAAAANGLFWLSQRGFDELNSSGSKDGDKAAVSIANSVMVKSISKNKPADQTLIQGLANFVDANYSIRKIDYYSVHDFVEEALVDNAWSEQILIEKNLDQLSLQKAKEGLTGSTVVMVKWGIYEPMENGNLEKKSESWGTVVGYGVNEHGVEKSDILIVHDPSDGEATRDKYFRVKNLEEFFMMTEKTQLIQADEDGIQESNVIPAGQKQFLSYYDKDKYESFAIWESLLILKVEDK